MPNYVDPDKERFARFKGLDHDNPIHMLNLVRLKAEAIYEDETKTTGREAYAASMAAKVSRFCSALVAGSSGQGTSNLP